MGFSFIQITDHHVRETEQALTRGFSPAHALRAVLRHIATHHADADFIVSTGDLAERGTDAEYQTARGIFGLGALSAAPGPQVASGEGLGGKPMYFLPGNHDPRDSFFRNMFAPPALTAPALPALNASFTHKGVRFVCIDWGVENKAFSTPAMLDHLACAMDKAVPTVVLSHHHVTPMGFEHGNDQVPDDAEAVAEILRRGNVLAILAGHTHATYERELGGVPVLGTRSTTFSFAEIDGEFSFVLRPPHYRVVSIVDGCLTSRVVEVRL